MSEFYPYEIQTATSEADRAQAMKDHKKLVREAIAPVALEVFSGLPYAGKVQLEAQARTFTRLTSLLLLHVPARHVEEACEALLSSCYEQLGVDPKSRPNAWQAVCDIHMIAAIPGAWSLNDLCGNPKSKLFSVTGARNVGYTVFNGDVYLDDSMLWLRWANEGFGKWTDSPQVGNEWDDWTPPPTTIKRYWDRIPQEDQRFARCVAALQYFKEGLNIAETRDRAWRKANGENS